MTSCLCPHQLISCSKYTRVLQVWQVHNFEERLQSLNYFRRVSWTPPIDAGPPIHHFDVYRLEDTANIDRLDLPSSFKNAVTLIEWADKLQQLPENRVHLHVSLVDDATKVCYQQ